MKLLSIIAMTEAQGIGLGWFIGALLILAVTACWCKFKDLFHHKEPTDQKKSDPPVKN